MTFEIESTSGPLVLYKTSPMISRSFAPQIHNSTNRELVFLFVFFGFQWPLLINLFLLIGHCDYFDL